MGLTIVNNQSGSWYASGSTGVPANVSLSPAIAIAAGSLVVVVGFTQSTAATAWDDAGNVYQVAKVYDNNQDGTGCILYCLNAKPLSTSQKIYFGYTSSTPGYTSYVMGLLSALPSAGEIAYEDAGVAAGASAVYPATNYSVTSGTPAVPGELIVALSYASQLSTPPAGFTQIGSTENSGITSFAAGYLQEGSATQSAETWDATSSTAGHGLATIAGFYAGAPPAARKRMASPFLGVT